MVYFIKEGNAAMVPRGTIAYFSLKLNPFPFAIGALLTHLDFLCYSLKTTTYWIHHRWRSSKFKYD
jgi:hypothetical protein